MPRSARIAPGGVVFHVLNRANGTGRLFQSSACYRDFLAIVEKCSAATGMRLLAYCAMPNHWHLLAWPRKDGDLARFVHAVTTRHTHRWHARSGTTGRGHLYQARYKSFPVRDDTHLLTVCRYIERNPVRAALVPQAEDWPWSSAAPRLVGLQHEQEVRFSPAIQRVTLSDPPVAIPADWRRQLREPCTDAEMQELRDCIRVGVPFGDRDWRERTAATLGLPVATRAVGRPKK